MYTPLQAIGLYSSVPFCDHDVPFSTTRTSRLINSTTALQTQAWGHVEWRMKRAANCSLVSKADSEKPELNCVCLHSSHSLRLGPPIIPWVMRSALRSCALRACLPVPRLAPYKVSLLCIGCRAGTSYCSRKLITRVACPCAVRPGGILGFKVVGFLVGLFG